MSTPQSQTDPALRVDPPHQDQAAMSDPDAHQSSPASQAGPSSSNLTQPKKSWRFWRKLEKNSAGDYYPTFCGAFRIILPNVTRREVAKYKKPLSNIEDAPILSISPNPQWVTQHGQDAYNAVMTTFATYALLAPNRRDYGSMFLFHFKNLNELYEFRNAIRDVGLAPNAFCVPAMLRDKLPDLQQEPIGRAWIITKLEVSHTEMREDDTFFVMA